MLGFVKTFREFLQERKRSTFDRTLILIFPILASFISVVFSVNALTGIILFLCIPSLYMSLRYPLYIKRSFTFALAFGVPFIILIDYMAHVSNTWLVPHTVFAFRILEWVTIESVIWGFAYVYFVIMYYEAFFDNHIRQKKEYEQLKSLYYVTIIVVCGFLLAYVYESSYLIVPFFYLFLGVVVIIPPIVWMCANSPKTVGKFVKTGTYFFILNSLYEFTALHLNHWSFPASGKFIAYFSIFNFIFPIEELIIWIVLSSVAIISCFEIFDDDSK